jgi:hypothetical protein
MQVCFMKNIFNSVLQPKCRHPTASDGKINVLTYLRFSGASEPSRYITGDSTVKFQLIFTYESAPAPGIQRYRRQ